MIPPKVEKHVVGEDAPSGAPFTFTLRGLDGAPMPNAPLNDSGEWEGTIFGEGELSIPLIRFTTAGTYSYEVREKALGADGWIYDPTVCRFDVVVEQKMARLSAEVQTDLADGSLHFTNSYKEPSATSTDDSTGAGNTLVRTSTPLAKTGDAAFLLIDVLLGVSLVSLVVVALAWRRGINRKDE